MIFNAEILYVEADAAGMLDVVIGMVEGRVCIFTHRDGENGLLAITNEFIQWAARETESNPADIMLFNCFPGLNNQNGAIWANGEWYMGTTVGNWNEESVIAFRADNSILGVRPGNLVIGETYSVEYTSRTQWEAQYGETYWN